MNTYDVKYKTCLLGCMLVAMHVIVQGCRLGMHVIVAVEVEATRQIGFSIHNKHPA